jgi:hypothetical protein
MAWHVFQRFGWVGKKHGAADGFGPEDGLVSTLIFSVTAKLAWSIQN